MNPPYLGSAEMEHPLNIQHQSHHPEDLDYAPFPRLSLRSALFLPCTEHRCCCPRREFGHHSIEASEIYLRSFPIWDRVGFETCGLGLVSWPRWWGRECWICRSPAFQDPGRGLLVSQSSVRTFLSFFYCLVQGSGRLGDGADSCFPVCKHGSDPKSRASGMLANSSTAEQGPCILTLPFLPP